MPEFTCLNATLADSIAWVELNRPDQANALDGTLWREIGDVFRWVDETSDIPLLGDARMQCAIYRSPKKSDTYLYLAARDDFSRVPETLLKMLGEPVHVMDLELRPERRLAQEDVREVLHNLREQGWHLQIPRQDDPLAIRH